MAMFDDEIVKPLFAEVLAKPTDGLPKLVLADRFDEIGQPWLAKAFRWCAKHGRHPHISEKGRFIAWFRMAPRVRKPEIYPAHLPRDLYELIRPRGKHPQKYRKPAEPFCALADTIRHLAELIES